MTDRMTAAQYREMIAKKAPGSPVVAGRSKSSLCPACDRTAALLRLLRLILADGYDVRMEHRFHPKRKWRFDIAVLNPLVAIEIDGGGWVGGAHHRAAGRDNDNEKDAAAFALGWRVLRVSWTHVKNGQAYELLTQILNFERGKTAS